MTDQNTSGENLNGLSGKALKAFIKLDKGLSTYSDIKNVLEKFYNNVTSIIGDKNGDKKKFPERIKFNFSENQAIDFYIDFIVTPTGEDNSWDLEGKIIYGVYNNIKVDSRDKDKCNICGGTIICNCVRSKSLLTLSINEQSLIESKDQIEDNWILGLNPKSEKDDVKTIKEIHYRALEYIFLEALYFMNERYTNL